MNSTRPLLKFVFAVVILAAVAQNKSYAGGFPTRPGRLILSPSVTYFFADKEWDSTGTKRPFPNNGKFNSINISLYAEYGISRRLAVVGTLPYLINNYKADNGASFPSSGAGDLEVGLKYYLANINYIYYFSLQGTAITPLYNNTLLGYDEEGAELKLSFAGSGTVFNRNYYFNIDNAARQYFGNSGPFQYRYGGTFGLSLDQKFENQISVGVSGFYSVSDDKQFIITNPTIARDFRFTQVSVTYGHAFSKEMTILLTGGQFITGRNTGVGTSGTVTFAFRLFN